MSIQNLPNHQFQSLPSLINYKYYFFQFRNDNVITTSFLVNFIGLNF